MRPRSTPFPVPRSPFTIVAAILALMTSPLVAQSDSAARLAHARAILSSSPLIDGHNDLPWVIREQKNAPMDVAAYDLRKPTDGMTDLARLHQGLVAGQFWSIYVPGEDKDSGYARIQLEEFDIARRMIAMYPDQLTLALTAADIEQAFKQKKIASLLGMEGGHAIENSLGALRSYYALGARYMTLTHNVTLDWADAALDSARHDGLTKFGEAVVHEMNRLGMLVDLSHVSPAVMSDAMNVALAPVIFSHSSCRALVDYPRNVPDSILARLKTNGGIVMVTFVPGFVSKELRDAEIARDSAITQLTAGVTDTTARDSIASEYRKAHPLPRATIADVADHLDHARQVAGADHIGIGSDFDGIDEGPIGLEDVSKFPNLFAELIRRGWGDDDLKKLAGLNLLRVLKQAESVAAKLQASEQPSTATIGS
jgi:membrane dipeptidase